MKPSRTFVAALSVAAILAGCGTSTGGGKQARGRPTPPATNATGTQTTTFSSYKPVVDAAQFSPRITNKYFPLKVGSTLIFEGVRDGAPTHTELVVTPETRKIMGVTTVVVRDTVTSNGALVEKTTDWYAQAANGDVWYFGEDTKEYDNGNVSSTRGTWEAGVDGAQPGIVMEAAPKVGDSYHQEFRPGVAEDQAKVLSVSETAKTPSGTYADVLLTEDTDPLSPDNIDNKSFAPGVGLVYSKRVRTGHHEENNYVKTVAS